MVNRMSTQSDTVDHFLGFSKGELLHGYSEISSVTSPCEAAIPDVVTPTG